jgi:hypothetical protein
MAPCFVANPMSGVAIRSWQVDFEPISSSGASSALLGVAIGGEGLQCSVRSLGVFALYFLHLPGTIL